MCHECECSRCGETPAGELALGQRSTALRNDPGFQAPSENWRRSQLRPRCCPIGEVSSSNLRPEAAERLETGSLRGVARCSSRSWS